MIKKQDQSAFTNEDYERIKGISNIDYIVEDDLFIDCSFSLNRDDMSFYGNILDIKNFRGNIDLGRKPNNDNEIINHKRMFDKRIAHILYRQCSHGFSPFHF